MFAFVVAAFTCTNSHPKSAAACFSMQLLGDVISVISVTCGAKTALQRRLYSAASRAATCMGVGASESPGPGDSCPPVIIWFQVDVTVTEFNELKLYTSRSPLLLAMVVGMWFGWGLRPKQKQALAAATGACSKPCHKQLQCQEETPNSIRTGGGNRYLVPQIYRVALDITFPGTAVMIW